MIYETPVASGLFVSWAERTVQEDTTSKKLDMIYGYSFAACQLFLDLLRILSGMNTGEDVQGLPGQP